MALYDMILKKKKKTLSLFLSLSYAQLLSPHMNTEVSLEKFVDQRSLQWLNFSTLVSGRGQGGCHYFTSSVTHAEKDVKYTLHIKMKPKKENQVVSICSYSWNPRKLVIHYYCIHHIL